MKGKASKKGKKDGGRIAPFCCVEDGVQFYLKPFSLKLLKFAFSPLSKKIFSAALMWATPQAKPVKETRIRGKVGVLNSLCCPSKLCWTRVMSMRQVRQVITKSSFTMETAPLQQSCSSCSAWHLLLYPNIDDANSQTIQSPISFSN